jgi:hypothetical protein
MTYSRPPFDCQDIMATTLSPLASRLLIGSWFSQLLLAIVITMVAPIPVRPLVIERRFCSESQQSAMLASYRALVMRDRFGIERFRPVVFYSVYGVQQIDWLPAANVLGLASTAGDGNQQEEALLRDEHPTALVLRCQQEP